MPYLTAKDELVFLNRLSSRGLWKWYNSKVLDRRLYGVGQHFTFCRFSRQMWFSKMFHKRVFSDWIWRISKFPFWRQILVIYRQPLLKVKSSNNISVLFTTAWLAQLGERGFKPLLNQHSGSLSNWEESATFVKTSAKELDFLDFRDKDENCGTWQKTYTTVRKE